ncbi:helix-turn-helix domain-containing protein [Mycobacterium sp. IDR2000157661]|uniref:helix-turn-helix domain-containing protein n=1 Tax=Mycobacterium sp. IDR2000157661 TaxID=2867005 RepID=UPI001EEB2AD4|nr:helix-turn-helix domain-containing protein [Mycobacterium sp. IDR2000157661]ULE33349.1 helix-turn-helix domain-containing protein [Mycobacterium sp. IDR2000157661]
MNTTETTKSAPTLDELRSGPPTISIEQAARCLGVSRAYGYTMAREGRLPTIQLGTRRVRVPALALLKMLGGAE